MRRHEIFTESVENSVENSPRRRDFPRLCCASSGLHQHGATRSRERHIITNVGANDQRRTRRSDRASVAGSTISTTSARDAADDERANRVADLEQSSCRRRSKARPDVTTTPSPSFVTIGEEPRQLGRRRRRRRQRRGRRRLRRVGAVGARAERERIARRRRKRRRRVEATRAADRPARTSSATIGAVCSTRRSVRGHCGRWPTAPSARPTHVAKSARAPADEQERAQRGSCRP